MFRKQTVHLYGLAVLWSLALGLPLAHGQTPVEPAQRGFVMIVGGVGGIDLLAVSARWALPHSGLNLEMREFVWTHGRGKILKDLQDTSHWVKKAQELAAELAQLKASDPNRPIYVVAKSGGAGLALAAAEQLPPRTLERIILLSAAVAPDYDLRPALRATCGEIVSFYSPLDQFVLNWGTSQFGTIDRVYGPSAGLKGFNIPRGLGEDDRTLYDRLVQVPWHPAMLREGHSGGHLGTSMPVFVAKEIAPWLKR